MSDGDRMLDAVALREWAHTAVGDLITHTDEINRLDYRTGHGGDVLMIGIE